MTSREIIIKLVDDKLITGEEAFTLINDICKQEMYDVWKTLESSKVNTTPNITWTTNGKYDAGPYPIKSTLGDSAASTATTYTVKSV